MGNFSALSGGTRKTCSGGTDHYMKGLMRGGVGHAHNSDNNLQLVHLLTTNPAAALPAIFPASGSSQKVYAHQAFQRPRISHAHGSLWRGEVNNHGVLDSDQIPANSWTASIMSERMPFRRQRSFSELYLSKEDLDKKACCIDIEGNFDFEALLPAVYWKPQADKDL